MKTIKTKIYLIAALFLINIACEDIMDQSNPNDPTLDEFYTTEESAVKGINAAYSALQFFGVYNRYWNYVNSGRSDESIFTDKQAGLPEVDGLDDFTMLGTVDAVHETWRDNYNGILKTNLVLEYVPNIDFSDENLKNRILGEAYFLRALYHFNLITNFGEEIPMYTSVPKTNEEFFPHSQAPGVIYDQIEADFAMAKSLLPNVENYRGTPDIGRVSKGAATAFLGKVYLFRGKYQEAADELYQVINGSCGHYELVDRFRDNHNNTYDPEEGYGTLGGPSVENNPESLFEVQYQLSAEGLDVWDISGENDLASEANIIEQEMTMVDGTGGMWWNQKPSPKMIAEFERDGDGNIIDPRYYKTFWCPGGDGYKVGRRVLPYESYISAARNGEFGWRKWCRDYATESWESDINIRVMRLAEVYLMFAESLIQNGVTPPSGAQNWRYYLNALRQRANNDPTVNQDMHGGLPTIEELEANPPVINGITLNTPMAILRHEKMVELAYEGQRWQDIVRWGIGEEIFGSQYKPWLPIYTTDLQTNPNLKPNSSN